MALNILFAFLGGILLNLMPCVLPVLSIKILHVLEGGQKRSHGIVYLFGILVSFWLLFGLLAVLRAQGHALGWGFQLQSPVFLAFTSIAFLILSLNLFGVFEWGYWVQRVAGSQATSPGVGQAFFSGVLAVFVASPCSAPFMGPAIAFALAEGPLAGFVIFTALGLGLAFPFLVVSLVPGSVRFLPRPGTWMIRLKQFLGLCMVAAVFWIIWIFSGASDRTSLAWLFVALWFAGGAAFFYGIATGNRLRIVALLLLIASGFVAFQYSIPRSNVEISYGAWLPYDARSLEAARLRGPVFVDFTADWCLSCKVNERVALDKREVMDAFKSKRVALFRADWTVESPEITNALAAFDRNSVPLYVFYPGPGKEPRVLPQILTPSIVLDELKEIKID
ncbi:MAG: thioredoxin family protein [Spirochaetia bacterium]|nr:thioredoxin family protein [Spirochaetia bacterium]